MSVAEEGKLFTPTFVMGWFANLFQFLVFYFLITTMALYAIKEFQASEVEAGFASSSIVIGAVFSRFFSGYIIDRFGRRKIVLISVLVTTIACALYLPIESLPLLYANRFLHGVGYAFAATAIMAMVQELIPASRRSEGTGYLALGTTVSAALGPALALFVLGTFDYDMLFIVVLATSVISLIAVVFMYFKTSDPEPSGEPAKFSFKSIMNPKIIPIGIFILLICFAYSGVIAYINAFAEERDLITGAGLFFIAYAVSMFVMRSFLGKLQDRRGDNVVIYFGLFFFVISLTILSFATSNWHVVLSGVIAGLGYGTLMPAVQSIAVGVVDKTEFGTAFSTLFLFVDLGFGFGPIILGAVSAAIGFGPMYAALAGVGVIAGIFYLFTHARTDRAKNGFVKHPEPVALVS
ncbi:putative antibiotic efflux permease, MFS-type [Corynebacterium glutamicum MB001]|uniref:Permeases of the major facilitator superfamily n=1 Tax=Corynebacterium glutamicum (strain ATCC 13032 / DSM 20300 / JCM 1318 / BCRC 11384 / CCUG 27702 / LMG 3730 / NBRC 12168 / NCIMB 10025 / NRRL B-2784 / 534) TaxID=196627 RepID=Q8NRI3_CORGL|nr:MFS transporter [Corynebacterium glutamicum]AGT05058.1 putative antibiotic efflux permease, MFS-type [Corynebacterium glutamicum MB001]AUI00606.1 MFS transporter [Corynebacterium glutamicum]AUI04250.1 MFS transporter [Corynebacterium glutamicum]MBA4570424.1 MFS transporter [Corynebacterium glutamicum]MBA4574006.1 MFS transporter [Corynebacterium glutamicum]